MIIVDADESRARSITPQIARRGIESSECLGRNRWIVECSHSASAIC
jgi:hypothetical protein